MPYPHKTVITIEDAEALALGALRFLAADDANWASFAALTGVDLQQARELAAEPAFLAGVLEFLVQHEPLLMTFCGNENVAPERPLMAYHKLSGDI